MRRLIPILGIAMALVAIQAAPASAAFGFKDLGFAFTDSEGLPDPQAGSHPFATETTLSVNTVPDPETGDLSPDGALRDLEVDLPAGFAGNPTATERCSAVDFVNVDTIGRSACPDGTAVGIAAIQADFKPLPAGTDEYLHAAVFNLVPPPGAAAKLGFLVLGVPVTIEVGVREEPPFNVFASLTNISQAVLFFSSKVTLWGYPADGGHDSIRGSCLNAQNVSPVDEPLTLGEECPVEDTDEAFTTAPRSCQGPLTTKFSGLAWGTGATDSRSAVTPGMKNCAKLGFGPRITAQLTNRSAEGPTGLDFKIEVRDEELSNPEGSAGSDIKGVEVTLPEGVTVNPSQAEGLGVCSEDDLASERASSTFGAGCPGTSKIGTVEVETPLLEQTILKGSLFVAEPHANLADDSLIAFYVVIKDPGLGILIVQPVKVEPDPDTGQLVATTVGDMPQLPFSDFRLRFREGGRSPLISPPTCGSYAVRAGFTPWADSVGAVGDTASFDVTSGVAGGSCPSGGRPPFEPGFAAGSLSNAAGSHSPFLMRLSRRDGDQDITRFDAVLPPGVAARLVGVAWCPDAAIARAKSRDGNDELRDPSCPPASRIGSVRAGAGVGSQLTYVPGSVYLAGPFGGAPLSVVGIVPAVAGPFDVGTVVTRQALSLDSRTGEVEVDGALSDPIPHILAGIPLKVRDIRVSVDRPAFTLNPTNCNPMATLAGIWGGGSHPFSSADDFPALRSARFQAAGCAALGFEPRLAIRLRGGVRRGAHPALRAIVTPPPGEANFSRAVVTLPRSAFLEQAHIRTICTRVQFNAPPGHGAHCPPGARYGFARAWSPLLDAPAQGPVFLRSSDNNLPDLVVALKGPASAPVDVELSSRIDSVRGGIRSTFAGIPDLPVSRFILAMQGGKKGLIVNSRHLCHKPKKRNRAKANLRGQNGRVSRARPRVIAVKCAKRRKAQKRRRAGRAVQRVSRASALR